MNQNKHGGQGRQQGRKPETNPRNIKKQLCWTDSEWFAVQQAAQSQGEKVTDFQRRVIMQAIKILAPVDEDLEIFTDDVTNKIYGQYDGCYFIFKNHPDGGTWNAATHIPCAQSVRKLSKLTWGSLYHNLTRFLNLNDREGWKQVHTVISRESHDHMMGLVLKGEDAAGIIDRAVKCLARS